MKISRRKAIQNSLTFAVGSTVLTNIPKTSEGRESNNSTETYSLKREITIEKEFDLLVAGGGPSGATAAICAARLGAKVLLVEATGCLGGMGTSGYVCAWDPMANGEQMVVGGFMAELVETMYKRNFLSPGINPETWRMAYHKWTPFSPEGLKLILDEKILEAGVELRYFTKVIDADVDKNNGIVNGIIINNIEGYSYIKAKTFIDATGDAVLSALCGTDYREAGIDTQHIMPATLPHIYTNINWNKKQEFGTQTTEGVELLEKEFKLGNLTQNDRHIVGISKIGNTIGYFNGGHIYNMRSTKIKDLSDGMVLGRKIAREYQDFMKKYLSPFKDMEMVATASVMGVRESRRIVGEYELNEEDYHARRTFPDQIAIYNKSIDIHPYDTSIEEYERFKKEYKDIGRLKPGEYFGIPYSILVPKNWQNLWTVGRCASSDVKVQGSIRVQPAASMMGQAAGTAAVQSIKSGQPACDLDTKMLISTLIEVGANLPQKELSKKMTRV